MKTDHEIQNDVVNELKWLPFLKLNNISVGVEDGIVTLFGRVDSYSEKLEVEKASLKVFGVKSVSPDSEIEVAHLNKSETAIAQSVFDSLKWPIKVKVESNTVTLEGEVEWSYQKESAKRVVADLVGSRDIVNLIRVKLKTTPIYIKEKISAALHRTASVDASRIEVEIAGNVVKLRGKVKSWSEKQDAANAARFAPGIRSVENQIEIEQQVDLAFERYHR
jgi:osmotically-inducible protein OsmY